MTQPAAGLDRDNRGSTPLEERYHALTPQLLAQNRLLSDVHPMKLKKVLRRLHTDSDSMFHGRSPVFDLQRPHSGTSMPSGAVHPNKKNHPLSRQIRKVRILATIKTLHSTSSLAIIHERLHRCWHQSKHRFAKSNLVSAAPH